MVANFMCNSWISRRKLIKLANRIYDIKRVPRLWNWKRQNMWVKKQAIILTQKMSQLFMFYRFILFNLMLKKQNLWLKQAATNPIFDLSIFQQKVQRLPVMNHYCLMKVKLNTLWAVRSPAYSTEWDNRCMNIGW